MMIRPITSGLWWLILLMQLQSVVMLNAQMQNPGAIFGGELFDRGTFVMPTSGRNLLLVGYSKSFSETDDFYVIKTNLNGAKIWDCIVPGQGNDYAFGAAEIDVDGYLIIGFSDSNSAYEDVQVTKITSNGKVVWTKYLSGNGKERAWSIQRLRDGNFLIAGQTQDNASKVYKGMLIKIDKDANIIWKKEYGALDYNRLFYFVETAKKDIVLTGLCRKDSTAENSGWVLVVNKDGQVKKNHILKSLRQTTPHGIIKFSRNKILVVGYAQPDTNDKERCVFLMSLTAKGKVRWQRQHYEKERIDHALSAVKMGRKIVVAGYTRLVSEAKWDAALYRFRRNGTFEQRFQVGDVEHDNFYTITTAADDTCFVIGHTYNFHATNADLWLVQVDAEGNIIRMYE